MDDILDAAQKKSDDPPSSPPPVDNQGAGVPPPLLDDQPILSSPTSAPTVPPQPNTDPLPSVLPTDSLPHNEPLTSLNETPPSEEPKIVSMEAEEVKPPDLESPPPNDVFSVPPASSPKKSKRGKGVLIATLLFLVLTLPLAVYFIANPQQLADLRKKAAFPSDEGNCGAYPCPTPYCSPLMNQDCATGCVADLNGGHCNPVPTPYCSALMNQDCATGCVPDNNGGHCNPLPTLSPKATATPVPNGYPCCGGSYGATCGSDETCRVDNGACPGSGQSCGKNACTANGTSCTPQTAGNCCSGLCANGKCVSGNGDLTCRTDSADVCRDEGGTAAPGAIACSSGGTSCRIGGVANCCYADDPKACAQNVQDGACYTGQGGCSGGSFTNNTGRTLTVSRYTRTSGGCPSTQWAGTSTLAPGASVDADDCEQFDVAGFCGYCNPSCGGGGETPTSTPGVVAQCLRIKVYKDNQVVATLSTLKAGDNVILSVAGSNASQGRIRVNGGAWNVTTTRNAAGEFTTPFTIPTTVSSFTIEAEVFRDGDWK